MNQHNHKTYYLNDCSVALYTEQEYAKHEVISIDYDIIFTYDKYGENLYLIHRVGPLESKLEHQLLHSVKKQIRELLKEDLISNKAW